MSQNEPAITEVLAVLGQTMDTFRRTAIIVEDLGVFYDVHLLAVPQSKKMEDACSATVSFFIDAELEEATRRAQVSLGVSLQVCECDGAWIAVPDIGWQFADQAGSAVATPWDSLDFAQLRQPEARAFFHLLPTYTVSLLEKYKDAAMEYSRACRGC